MARSPKFPSLALLLPLVLGSAAPLQSAEIHAGLHASWVAGDSFATGSQVRVILRDRAGALKGVANASIASGSWWLSFGSSPAPVTVGAGDKLQVLIDGTSIGTMGVPGITADTNPGTDVTSGRVVAAPGAALPAAIELDLYLVRLLPTPTPRRTDVWTDATVPIAADGRFSKSWRSGITPRNLRRNDEITARLHLTGPGGHVWNFSLPALVTGMSIYEGLDSVRVEGPVTNSYALSLATAGGFLKARTGVTLLDPGSGTATFTAAGAPVRITPGLIVRLVGPGAHAAIVPKLTGVANSATDSVSGSTLPATVVEASLTHDMHDAPTRVYALSNALGAFAMTFPEDVVAGDLIELRIQRTDGTWIVRRLPVAY